MQFEDASINLAGPPVKRSPAIDPADAERRKHAGLIKVRLGHSINGTYLVPEVLIGVAGARYYVPSFFDAPMLAFNMEDGRHRANFSIDVAPPREAILTRLTIEFYSDERVLSYADGAQLYRCTYDGPRRIARYASGLCHALPDGDFALTVFHHTNPAAALSIEASGQLWSSPWNLAGTRELHNVAYAYFTVLSDIRDEIDLHSIAMASEGEIRFQTTSDRTTEEVLRLKVYRGDTSGRTVCLPFDVPSALIAPAHIYLHRSVGANGAYYEIVGSEIVRVGLRPDASLVFTGKLVAAALADVKRFDYIILGDAFDLNGLAAPYDEEDTTRVTHIERLDQGLDLFEFWLINQNSDQSSGRAFEKRLLKPSL